MIPKIKNIENIFLPEIEFQRINDISVYMVPGNLGNLVKIELIFPAGRKYEYKKALARTTNALIREGCEGMSANSFAEAIDYYGFYLNVQSNLDYAHVSLVSLGKYFEKGIELLLKMLFTASFEEEEVEKYTHVAAQNLELQLQKNEFLSYREFTRLLFGDEHIYGYNTSVEAFKNLTRDDLLTFYKQQYIDKCQAVILSGDIKAHSLDFLKLLRNNGQQSFEYVQEQKSAQGMHQFNGGFDLQTAIKMGKPLFNRHHADFADVFIVNTILGGYFGSRLMKNIRENKGYTYNIYSSLDTLVHDGYFSINCEVNPKHVSATLKEIEGEIQLLQNVAVADDELKMVRNYMLGQMLHTLDGPFNSSKLLRSLICDDLDFSFVKNLISRIQNISSDDILNASRQYLTKEDFVTTIVGPKS